MSCINKFMFLSEILLAATLRTLFSGKSLYFNTFNFDSNY